MYAGIVDSDSDSDASNKCDGKTTGRDLVNFNPLEENIYTGKFRQVECKYAENIQQLSFANPKGNKDSLNAGHATKTQNNCLDNLKRYAADNFKLHSKNQSKANPTQDFGHAFCSSESESTKGENQDVQKTTKEKDYKMKSAVGSQSFLNPRYSAPVSKVPEKPSLATLFHCSGDKESNRTLGEISNRDIFIEQTCMHFPPGQKYLNGEDISIHLEEANQKPFPKLTYTTNPTEEGDDDCEREQSLYQFSKDHGFSDDPQKHMTSYSCIGQTFKHSNQKRSTSENTSKMCNKHVCAEMKSQQSFLKGNLTEETRIDRGVSFAENTEVKYFPPDHKAHELCRNKTDKSFVKHGPMKQWTEKPKLEMKSATCPGDLDHINEYVRRKGTSTFTAAHLAHCLTTNKVSNGLYEASDTPELTVQYCDLRSDEKFYPNSPHDQVQILPTGFQSKLDIDRPPMDLRESSINHRPENQRPSPSVPTTSGQLANTSVSISDDNRWMVDPNHASSSGACSPGFVSNNLSRSNISQCERKHISQSQTCDSLNDQGIPYVNTALSLRECPRVRWLDGLYFPPNLWQSSSEETIIPDLGTTPKHMVKGDEEKTISEGCKSPTVRRNHHYEIPLHSKADVSEFIRKQRSGESCSEGNVEGSENKTEKAGQHPMYMIGSLDLLNKKTVEESMLIFMLYKKYKRVKNFINRKTQRKLTILNYRVNYVWHVTRKIVSSKSKGFKNSAKKYNVCRNFC